MRILFLIFFTILLSCSKDINHKKSIKFDINDNLTFDKFKELIENEGFKKDYPDINK